MSDRNKTSAIGLTPGEWEDLFRRAGVQTDALDGNKSHRSRATLLGNFLARNLDREIAIEVDGRTGTARLRAADAGKRQRRYYFEVTWDGTGPAVNTPGRGPGGGRSASTSEGATEPPRRRKHRKTRRADRAEPAAAGVEVPPPGQNGEGNAEDWS
jgi:hypothetical protein